jgi:co-chaperonin GroES (HSP10)
MRDRLVLKEIPHDQTVTGIHIIRQDDGNDRSKAEKLVRGTIRARVVAQGVGMLVGEQGNEFEVSLPKVTKEAVGIAEQDIVCNWDLVGRIVVVSYYAGFEDEDPITGEKLIIVTPLDILAVVEEN